MAPVDRYGFDEETNPNQLARLAANLVPRPLARRAVTVSVTTDRERYSRGEPVEIAIELHNRLPVPIRVATRGRRLWGWAVDGEVAASDEVRYVDGARGTLHFRGRERKRFHRRWDGRFERVGEGDAPTSWEPADGTCEIEAFVALRGRRAVDTTTIRIE